MPGTESRNGTRAWRGLRVIDGQPKTLLTDAQVQEIVSCFDYQTTAAQPDVALGRNPAP
jgi:hypothetical protein